MLHFLNYFFFIFHTAFTVFNMVGWISVKTRKWHLLTIILTALSWFVLGIWYGFGYCVCTDWHMDVRRQLGYHDSQQSYIQFLIFKLTGVELEHGLVEMGTLIVFLIVTGLSIWLNIRDWKRKKEIRRGRRNRFEV